MVQAAEALAVPDFDDLPPVRVAVAKRTTDETENVLRPSFARGAGGQNKPQLNAALDAVVQAADLIKAAGERAATAEEQARIAELNFGRQIAEMQLRLDAAIARADETDLNMAAVIERTAERLSEADEAVRAAREQSRLEGERADEAEGRAAAYVAQADEAVRASRFDAQLQASRAETAERKAAAQIAKAEEIAVAAQDEARLQAERAEATEREAALRVADAEERVKDADERVYAAETRALEAREDLAYLESHIRDRFGM